MEQRSCYTLPFNTCFHFAMRNFISNTVAHSRENPVNRNKLQLGLKRESMKRSAKFDATTTTTTTRACEINSRWRSNDDFLEFTREIKKQKKKKRERKERFKNIPQTRGWKRKRNNRIFSSQVYPTIRISNISPPANSHFALNHSWQLVAVTQKLKYSIFTAALCSVHIKLPPPSRSPRVESR